MKISVPFIEKKEKPDYFLALILKNEKAISIIFEKEGNVIKYVSTNEESFDNTIEDADNEHFLAILDKVITTAESALPENIETHKTIFGLKENWIEDNKIKKEYLEKLKKASEELSLNPIGFLIFSESIVNLIQKEEGAPATAVIAEVGRKFITVSLAKAGKLIETKTSEIHESPSYTVDALLKHLQTPEVLPSRIILLNSAEEDLTQEFINHQWSKSLPFLHLPQIVNLPKNASVKAMLLGAATQMGAQLIYDASEIDSDEEKPTKIEPEEFQETKIEPPIQTDEIKPESQHPLDYVEHEKSMDLFGFVEGEDIVKTPPPQSAVAENVPEKIAEETIGEIPDEVVSENEEKKPLPVNTAFVAGKFQIFANKAFDYLKKIKLDKNLITRLKPKNLNGKQALIIPIIALVIVIILAVFLMHFLAKATVTISVSTKTEAKTASVTFSANSPTDTSNNTLASQFISVSEDGSATAQATGQKDIGDKAKGTVTVFNNDTNPVTFSAGTTITSSNNLGFILDKSVTVASASGDIFSGTKPGTADVTVTASDIGQNYNLPSGTKFTIGSNANAAAKNDNAFSGGTKKSVTVVSSDDQQKLLAALPKQLEARARDDIKSKVQSGQSLLPDFVEETVTSPSFDKKVNDQASQFSLKATVDFKAATYTNDDLLSLANTLFTTSDVILSKENLSASAKNIKVEKNNDVTADLTINAKLLPKMDNVGLAKEIAGYSLQKAKNTISNLPQVENVDIKINPGIPFLTSSLPGNYKNITIKVVSN